MTVREIVIKMSRSVKFSRLLCLSTLLRPVSSEECDHDPSKCRNEMDEHGNIFGYGCCVPLDLPDETRARCADGFVGKPRMPPNECDSGYWNFKCCAPEAARSIPEAVEENKSCNSD